MPFRAGLLAHLLPQPAGLVPRAPRVIAQTVCLLFRFSAYTVGVFACPPCFITRCLEFV